MMQVVCRSIHTEWRFLMKRSHGARIPGTIGLVAILILLLAGCYRPVVTPDQPTATAEEDTSAPSDEDVVATAHAEATRGAQTMVAQTETADLDEGGSEPADVVATDVPVTEEATEEPEPAASPTMVEQEPAAEQPTEVPQPEPTSEPTAASQPTSSSGQTVHVVRPNETVFSISRLYGVTVGDIVSANNLADATTIFVGQELIIPSTGTQIPTKSGGATTYVVKRGDNLYRIALAFGLTYQQLAQYNGIADPDDIYAGQVLRIPAR